MLIHHESLRLSHVFPELEAVLVLCGAVVPTALLGGDRNPREGTDDESEDEQERSKYGRSRATPRAARTKKNEDSGSELDM
jgi:hypothetical protein